MKITLYVACSMCLMACTVRAGQPAPTPAAPGMVTQRDVRAYGALGNGQALDTASIQAAIDGAAAAGGGTVRFPAGTFLTGALALKDDVTLYLDAGATLLGSTNVKDYGPHRSLIHAKGARNIAIIGRGVIDGQGGGPKKGDPSAPDDEDALRSARARGKIIDFDHCRRVRIQGVTLRNSPNWMQHYFECEDVRIDGITVRNHCNHYNDGVDIDNCRNVRISNCRISSGDDAIVLKSRSQRFCENITVTNCIVSSHSNGIKLGTESHGGFRNVTVTNCVVVPVDPDEPHRNGARQGLGGITLATVDGAVLEKVLISNITIRGTVAPLFCRLGNRGRKLRPDMAPPPIGRFRNVVLSNIIATEATSVGCALVGLPGHPIENLTLSDISITFGRATEFRNYVNVPPGGTIDDVRREIPELPDAYPECVMFGRLPAYGFYARHVNGLTLRNVRLNWTTHDQRPAVFCEDVEGLSVDSLRAMSTEDAASVVFLKDVRTALIRGCIATPDTNTFLTLQGKTAGVNLLGNNLTRAAKAVELGSGVPRQALFESANSLQQSSVTDPER